MTLFLIRAPEYVHSQLCSRFQFSNRIGINKSFTKYTERRHNSAHNLTKVYQFDHESRRRWFPSTGCRHIVDSISDVLCNSRSLPRRLFVSATRHSEEPGCCSQPLPYHKRPYIHAYQLSYILSAVCVLATSKHVIII